MKHKFLGLLSIFFVLNAMATNTPALLRRETNMSLQPCDTSGFTANLPLTNAYLNNIKQRLAAASPEVFRDDLAPENICVGAQHTETGGRAWANTRARSVTIEKNLILRAQNDAQIAFLLAHEMAHISMRHFLDATPVAGPDAAALQRLAREESELTEILFAVQEEDAESVALGERIDAISDQIRTLTRANVGAEVAANWVEAEGDQVGANFYLRAGFTSNEVDWRTQQVILNRANHQNVYSPPPAMSSAQRLAAAYRVCGVNNPESPMAEPPRGTLRYTGECWSMWNLFHAEPARSVAYAVLLNDTIASVNVETSPNLEQVKAELRDMAPPNPIVSNK